MTVVVGYGAFRPPGRHQRLGVLTDDGLVLDLSELAGVRSAGGGGGLGARSGPPSLLDLPWPELLLQPALDALLAAGPAAWREVHGWLAELFVDPAPLAPYRRPVTGVTPGLSFTVADYVDFFACEQHAVNAARIFRPEDPDPLPPSWRHQPIGYHGRAGTVVGSGTDIRRPNGQRGPGDVGPTRMLDFEAELGYVLGGPASTLGEPVALAEAAERVFGVVLLNDWSARDVQFFESRPLGPLLGKAFATSVSTWVTPLEWLAAARVPPPPREPEPPGYLLGDADRGLNLGLTVSVNGEVIATPRAGGLYWTPAQLAAHLSSGGAVLRPGDLLGSGTISGPNLEQRGCLLELTWHGREPLALADGTELGYLRDGDEVLITASAPGVGGCRQPLGEVRGRVLPAVGAGPT